MAMHPGGRPSRKEGDRRLGKTRLRASSSGRFASLGPDVLHVRRRGSGWMRYVVVAKLRGSWWDEVIPRFRVYVNEPQKKKMMSPPTHKPRRNGVFVFRGWGWKASSVVYTDLSQLTRDQS